MSVVGLGRSDRFLVAVILAVVMLVLAGCGAEEPGATSTSSSPMESPAVQVELVRSEARRSGPSAPSADIQEATADGNRFAMALFQAVRSPEDNLVFSPYSLSIALDMTLAGARGETEKEMLEALRLQLPAERVHPAMNALALRLQASADTADQAAASQNLTLTLQQANSLWGQTGERYESAFLDTLAQNYGAGLRLMGNLSSEEARQAINAWVDQETSQQVPELLPPGALGRGLPVYLVLVNALVLSAPWEWPFDPSMTSRGPFHLPDGGNREVPMMHQDIGFPYGEGVDYQAVELPYTGGEFSLVVLLPAQGRFEEFATTLDHERVQSIFNSLAEDAPPLTLPRFTVEWRQSVKEGLQALGMRLAFNQSRADLTGMNAAGGIWVDDVYHASRVAADEAGTVAAAGSAALVTGGISEQGMVVDRPFLFFLRHRESGAILFVGQVVDPTRGTSP